MLSQRRAALATLVLAAGAWMTAPVHGQTPVGAPGRGFAGPGVGGFAGPGGAGSYGGRNYGGLYGDGSYGSRYGAYGGYSGYGRGYGDYGRYPNTPGYGAPGYGAPGYGAPGYGAPGYGAPGYGGPGYGGAPGGGYPANPYSQNNPNNQQNFNPYVIIPYSIPQNGGQSSGGYPGYGQQNPPGASAPQQRLAPMQGSTYLFGQEGSASFYATPPGDAAPTDPQPPANSRPYFPEPSDIPPVPIPTQPTNFASVRVHVPAEAHLWFEGTETKQTGTDRSFRSPPIDPGRPYLYDIKARWWQNGKAVEKTRTITVLAGLVTHVDLTTDGN